MEIRLYGCLQCCAVHCEGDERFTEHKKYSTQQGVQTIEVDGCIVRPVGDANNGAASRVAHTETRSDKRKNPSEPSPADSFDRVKARLSQPLRRKGTRQARADLRELARRAANAAQCGYAVQLSPYLKTLMRLEGVK